MGQRANLVILEGGDWRLFYDHWCANTLDVEMFWGPEAAVAFIEQCDAPDETAWQDGSAWLDEVWCEGAALVDLDRKRLLFFGGEEVCYDIPLRRALLALMTETWPGWQITWADEGIAAIGTSLGLPKEKFLIAGRPDPSMRFEILEAYPEDNLTLLTFRRGEITTALLAQGSSESLGLGPAALEGLEGRAGVGALACQGEMLQGGVHLDFDRRSLGHWWSEPTPDIEARVAAAWPGWQATWFRDRYEEQLRLAGLDIELPVKPLAERQAELLERIARLAQREACNPAEETARLLKQRDLSINPATEMTRGSVGSEARKQALLDDLRRRLPIAAAEGETERKE